MRHCERDKYPNVPSDCHADISLQHIIERIVRFFTPLLDSSIAGLTVLITNLFQSIIKWASCHKDQLEIADQCHRLFADTMLSEFYPFTDGRDKLAYCLCKLNLRFLKIVVQGCGIAWVIGKLPLLFHYLLQTTAIDITASISGDVFSAAFRQLEHASGLTV